MRTRLWTVIAGLFLLSAVTLPHLTMGPEANTAVMSDGHDSTVWFRQASWTEEERTHYYHLTSGTQIIPYSWFLALEQSDNQESFTADDHMKQLHLIPDPKHPQHNPDGLPIGFAKTVFPDDPKGIKEYIGITCAFCHTGELHATTKDRGRLVLYVEGGASMQDNAGFLKALLTSLAATAKDDAKLSRFAAAVLKEWNTDETRNYLRKKLVGTVEVLKERSRPEVGEWGLGRFDALNRGSNLVFMPLHRDNEHPLNAPVSIPPLWNVHLYDWVQWNGAIQNPLARNIAQVIGIGSGLFQDPRFLDPGDPKRLLLAKRPTDPFLSSSDIDKLQQLERMVAMIRPPRWPEEVFGAIDIGKASAGKKLYRDHCKHCHVPSLMDSQTRFGQRFKMTMIPPTEVGTDPEYLAYDSRLVRTGPLEDDFQSKSLSAAEASGRLTTALMRRHMDDPGPNEWESHGLLARPHAGVWATPPFLHNGSIPTLYEVLSPVEERSGCFSMADLEYDPLHVGYQVRKCSEANHQGDFKFDTAKKGNSNAGHEFRKDDPAGHVFTPEDCKSFHKGGRNGVLGCAFTPQERMAIIEYLKTCDLDEVAWNPHETPRVCRSRRAFLPE